MRPTVAVTLKSWTCKVRRNSDLSLYQPSNEAEIDLGRPFESA